MTFDSLREHDARSELHDRIRAWDRTLAEASESLREQDDRAWRKHADDVDEVRGNLAEAARRMPYSGRDDLTELKDLVRSLGTSVENLLSKLTPG